MLAGGPGGAGWSVVSLHQGLGLLAVSNVGRPGRIVIVCWRVVGSHVYFRECRDIDYDEGKGLKDGGMV